jgi:WD40 repeat protein
MALRHDAFISYSHAADSPVADALERGLEKLAKPLLKLHALDVFRDQTSLTASPALWPAILAHLSVSDWFLFLASPTSAASVWCGKEVQWWLENRSPDRMLMVLTEGDIMWDAAARDFDWSRTNSLPRLLERRCADEPLYVDLRWARGSDQLSLRSPKFREVVVNVAAPIRGIPKDELDSADLRQLARNRLLVRGGIAAITLAAVVAIWQAIVANQQRVEAEHQRDIAVARQLMAQSELLRAQQPDRLPLALLMAAEAARAQPDSIEAQQTLFASLAPLPRALSVLPHSGEVIAAVFSHDRKQVATAVRGAEGKLWSVEDAKPIAPLSGANRMVVYSPDDKLIAGCCQGVTVWTRSGEVFLKPPNGELLGTPQTVVFSADNRWLAIGIRAVLPSFVVYDLELKQQRFRYDATRRGNATALAFTPGGELYVALAEEIEIYDPTHWRAVRKLAPKIGDIHRLAFSRDGRHLAASGGADVVVYDLKFGQERRLEAHNDGPGRIEDLKFDPTGEYLGAVGLLSTGSIWRVETWRQAVAVGHGESYDTHTLSFDTTGGEAISCASDGNCLGWSLATGSRTHRFAHVYLYTGAKIEGRQMLSGTFSADGSLFVSGGADHTARIWSMSRAGEVSRSRCELDNAFVFTFVGTGVARHCWPERPGGAIFAPVTTENRRFAAATVPFDTVHVWDVNSGKPLATLAHTDPVDWDALKARLEATVQERVTGTRFASMRSQGSVQILAIAPSGRQVVTYRGADQTVRLWDAESARVTYHEVLEKQPYLHFLSETTLLRTDEPGTLSIRQLPAGNALWSKDLGNIKALAVTRDAHRIATLGKGAADVSLRVSDVATGHAILEQSIDSAAGGLHFDESGRYLTVTSHFGAQAPLTGLPPAIAIAVWDIAARRTVVSHPREATTVAFTYSHDGSQFATVGSNGDVHVWGLSTGASRRTVTADPGPVAFSANGRWLAVGLHSLRVLDAATLNPVAQLDIGGEIRAIEFQADDAIVAALRVENGGRTGLVERHRWRTADKIAEACSRIPLETAQRQWRQLLPAQPVPTPCAEPAPGLLSPQQ